MSNTINVISSLNKDMKMSLSETIQIPMVGFGTYLINDEDALSCVFWNITRVNSQCVH